MDKATNHWYPPYDERIFPVYEKIQQLKVPILFYSGILSGNRDSSRFCRPVNFEVMIDLPKIRFALAHIGWPWTDECIAVAGRFAADVLDPVAGLQEHAPIPPGRIPTAPRCLWTSLWGLPEESVRRIMYENFDNFFSGL